MAHLCTACKLEKPYSEFGKGNRSSTGLNYRCKSCIKTYTLARKELKKEYDKKRFASNKQLISNKSKVYYKKNKEIIIKKVSDYYEKNKQKVSRYKAQYVRTKRATDPFFKTKDLLRKRINAIFKKNKKIREKNSQKLLGCAFKTAQLHIESTWKQGMSWENQGKWHIDHVVPLASATTIEELEKLCHYTNLQALWALENLRKGRRYEQKKA